MIKGPEKREPRGAARLSGQKRKQMLGTENSFHAHEHAAKVLRSD